jgi:hypothetical protein
MFPIPGTDCGFHDKNALTFPHFPFPQDDSVIVLQYWPRRLDVLVSSQFRPQMNSLCSLCRWQIIVKYTKKLINVRPVYHRNANFRRWLHCLSSACGQLTWAVSHIFLPYFLCIHQSWTSSHAVLCDLNSLKSVLVKCKACGFALCRCVRVSMTLSPLQTLATKRFYQ